MNDKKARFQIINRKTVDLFFRRLKRIGIIEG